MKILALRCRNKCLIFHGEPSCRFCTKEISCPLLRLSLDYSSGKRAQSFISSCRLCNICSLQFQRCSSVHGQATPWNQAWTWDSPTLAPGWPSTNKALWCPKSIKTETVTALAAVGGWTWKLMGSWTRFSANGSAFWAIKINEGQASRKAKGEGRNTLAEHSCCTGIHQSTKSHLAQTNLFRRHWPPLASGRGAGASPGASSMNWQPTGINALWRYLGSLKIGPNPNPVGTINLNLG